MVESQCFTFENEDGNQSEDRKRDELLDDFELPQIKRTAIVYVTDSVCRNHKAIFKQGNTPAKQNNHGKGELAKPSRVLQSQMAIPCKCHENIGTDQQQYSI